jgi:hypothetical protein
LEQEDIVKIVKAREGCPSWPKERGCKLRADVLNNGGSNPSPSTIYLPSDRYLAFSTWESYFYTKAYKCLNCVKE